MKAFVIVSAIPLLSVINPAHAQKSQPAATNKIDQQMQGAKQKGGQAESAASTQMAIGSQPVSGAVSSFRGSKPSAAGKRK